MSDGAFPLVAVAEDKRGSAPTVLRNNPAAATPRPRARPSELRRKVLRYSQLKPAAGVRLASRSPDRVITMTLDGGMAGYN